MKNNRGGSGLDKTRTGHPVQVDFPAGQATFLAHLPSTGQSLGQVTF